jgi:hypothetical protein
MSSCQDFNSINSTATSPSIAQHSPVPQHLQLLSQTVSQPVHLHEQLISDVSTRKRKHDDITYDDGLSVECEQAGRPQQRQQHDFGPRKRQLFELSSTQQLHQQFQSDSLDFLN